MPETWLKGDSWGNLPWWRVIFKHNWHYVISSRVLRHVHLWNCLIAVGFKPFSRQTVCLGTSKSTRKTNLVSLPLGITTWVNAFKSPEWFFWCGLKISWERHFRNGYSSNTISGIKDVLALKMTADGYGYFMASILLNMLFSPFA